MKKKIFCFLVTLFILKTISAQGYYDDYGDSYCYKGYFAQSRYVGTTATTINTYYYDWYENAMQEEMERGSFVTPLQKLSKLDSTLLWGALGIYDYEPGEVYLVLIFKMGAVKDGGTVLLVEIEEDKSCSWYGFKYSRY